MTLMMTRGGNVSLSQADPALRTVLVGLSWPMADAEPPFEIDASLFLLTAEGTNRPL